MTRVLVTGASGFIGSALIDALSDAGYAVRSAGRTPVGADHVDVPQLNAFSDWSRALEGVSAIVHLAGPAHARMSESAIREGIVEATSALAAQAAQAGVTRFIYVSSIKAAAARTHGPPVTERAKPDPRDSYGRAKLAAEQALRAHPALRPVILRPPLVFAPGAKANFARLLWLADTGLPLPLGGLNNRRSLISRASFNDAILAVLRANDHPGGVFHVADQPALSTGKIVAALRRGMEGPQNMWPARFVRPALPRVLRDDLDIDAGAFRAAFGYPGVDVVAALEECAAVWKRSQ